MELNDRELRLISSGLFCLIGTLTGLGDDPIVNELENLSDKICRELDDRRDKARETARLN